MALAWGLQPLHPKLGLPRGWACPPPSQACVGPPCQGLGAPGSGGRVLGAAMLTPRGTTNRATWAPWGNHSRLHICVCLEWDAHSSDASLVYPPGRVVVLGDKKTQQS